MSEPKTEPTPKKEGEKDGPFTQVKKAWGWLGIGLALVTQGIGGYIQHLVQPYFTVWEILWATFPLTLAVAICAFLTLRDVNVSGFSVFCIIVGTLFFSAFTGVTSGTRVVQYLYHPEYRCEYTIIGYTHKLCFESGYSAPSGNLALAVLSGYVHIYGIVGFIRAILVGCFVGFGADRLIAGVAQRTKRVKVSTASGKGT